MAAALSFLLFPHRVLRKGDDLLVRLRLLSLRTDEVEEFLHLFVADESALYAAWLRRADGIKEHVALAEELLRAARVENRARVDLA